MRNPARIAVIDIGTNSVKMQVADVSLRSIKTVFFDRRTTRIGAGIAGSGRIGRRELEVTAVAVRRFAASARRDGASRVYAFSTHALRRAVNANAALRRLGLEAGTNVRVITGREEARLASLSSLRVLGKPKPHAILFDVGGGSVELALARSGEIVAATSLSLGALHMTNRFLKSDPIASREYKRLTDHLHRAVGRWFCGIGDLPPARLDLVGSGGAVTTLAAMTAQKDRRDRSVNYGDLRRLEERCLGLSLSRRKRLPGLPADRADIIPAGLAVVLTVMRFARKRSLRVNPGGVREGLMIHLAENNFEWLAQSASTGRHSGAAR